LKLLVASSRAQGDRAGDFFWCVEGELVYLGFVCASDEADPDGGCGCGRAFSGMSSHRATTTAEVRELDMTREDVAEALASSLEEGGYGRSPDLVEALVEQLLAVPAGYPAGTILERRLDEVRARGPAR
jgi:hypothetical protein